MNITYAHAYFLSNFPDRMETFFERFPNVSIDLTPGIEMFEGFTRYRERWIQFYLKHQDRIVFGTDNRVSPNEQVVGHEALKYANKLYAEVRGRDDVNDTAKQEIRECVEFFEKRL